jgi:hypothetical protein
LEWGSFDWKELRLDTWNLNYKVFRNDFWFQKRMDKRTNQWVIHWLNEWGTYFIARNLELDLRLISLAGRGSRWNLILAVLTSIARRVGVAGRFIFTQVTRTSGSLGFILRLDGLLEHADDIEVFLFEANPFALEIGSDEFFLFLYGPRSAVDLLQKDLHEVGLAND